MTSILLEFLQLEYKCVLTGLPHGGRPVGDLSVSTDKLYNIKEAFFLAQDDPEMEEFILMYLEALKICK